MFSSPVQQESQKKFLYALAVITLGGLALRLHGLWSESISADELDTLWRIKRSSGLKELLGTYVRTDYHPPFVHLFEYFWIKIAGTSEGALRFPFALMSTGAIWFSGRVAAKWFSTGAGLMTAAGMAFLQFPLLYGQLARPYAAGIFFTTAAAWYWTKLMQAEKMSVRDRIFFVLATAGAAYSHYFSLMVTALLGLSGIFFCRKENLKHYLGACAVAVLLFLPFTKIFLAQMGEGGVGGKEGWLAPPTPAFFKNHFWFMFDESMGVIAIVALIVAVMTFFNAHRPGKYHLLALLLFALPLFIGYFYSIYRNPVLQNSVLLFALPFFLMLIFSYAPEINGKWTMLFPGVFALVSLGYVTIYKPFHLTNYLGRIKDIAVATEDADRKYGRDNYSCVFNFSYPFYINYYFDALPFHPTNILDYQNGGQKDLLRLRHEVANAKGNYFIYAWSTTYSPPEALEIIREKFPKLVDQKLWFNSEWYLFSCDPNAKALKLRNDTIFHSKNELGDTIIYSNAKLKEERWSLSSNIIRYGDSTFYKHPENYYLLTPLSVIPPEYMYVPSDYSSVERLDSTHIYSSTMTVGLGTALWNPDNIVLVKAKIIPRAPNAKATIVIEFDRSDTLLHWNGIDSNTQVDSAGWGAEHDFYFAVRLPEDLLRSDKLKVYVFSSNKLPVDVESIEVLTLNGHRGLFGSRPDFQ